MVELFQNATLTFAIHPPTATNTVSGLWYCYEQCEVVKVNKETKHLPLFTLFSKCFSCHMH